MTLNQSAVKQPEDRLIQAIKARCAILAGPIEE